MGRVDTELVRARLERMLDEVDAIETRLPSDEATYLAEENEDLRYGLQMRLFFALQAVLDVATHIAAVHDVPELDSYSAGLTAVVRLEVASEPVVERLAGAAGLRNAIAHGYLEIDQRRVYAALSATDDMREFASEVWTWVEKR